MHITSYYYICQTYKYARIHVMQCNQIMWGQRCWVRFNNKCMCTCIWIHDLSGICLSVILEFKCQIALGKVFLLHRVRVQSSKKQHNSLWHAYGCGDTRQIQNRFRTYRIAVSSKIRTSQQSNSRVLVLEKPSQSFQSPPSHGTGWIFRIQKVKIGGLMGDKNISLHSDPVGVTHFWYHLMVSR